MPDIIFMYHNSCITMALYPDLSFREREREREREICAPHELRLELCVL
jgi:hypothetical protein